jgi:hypothetical protein
VVKLKADNCQFQPRTLRGKKIEKLRHPSYLVLTEVDNCHFRKPSLGRLFSYPIFYKKRFFGELNAFSEVKQNFSVK